MGLVLWLQVFSGSDMSWRFRDFFFVKLPIGMLPSARFCKQASLKVVVFEWFVKKHEHVSYSADVKICNSRKQRCFSIIGSLQCVI